MIYLLDTNILIYRIRNRPPQVAERIDALDGKEHALAHRDVATVLQDRLDSGRTHGAGLLASPVLWPSEVQMP